MRRLSQALTLAVLASGVAGAQQSRDSTRADSLHARILNAVVVTASRRQQRISDSPVTTEIISRADVERSGAADLNTLLTQYTGVQPEPSVVGSGGVQMEGLSSQHVLLLIDGQPLVGRIDGELDLSRVPVDMIDRVEIIKGPLSTLYGSSAMGGVINIITRDVFMNHPSVSASLTGGTQGRFDASSSLSGGVGDVRGLVQLGRREDDIQAGRTNQSGARSSRWDSDGKLHWAPEASRLKFDASILGVREDQRWQSGQLFFFSNNAQQNARLTANAMLSEDRTHNVSLTLYYSRFSHLSRQATIPEPASDSGDVSAESLGRAELTYGGMLAGQAIDAGVALDRGALTASRIIGGHRTSTSVEPYLQYTVDRGALSLVPGARVSRSDEWGTHFTPKLAALYALGNGFTLRASAAAGYRAPEFKELYITFLNSAVGYVVHGNPALQPETSTNVSSSVEWSASRGYVRVQGYSNRFANFIESVQAPDSGIVQQFTYGNVAHGVTRGADVEAGFAVEALSIDASYGYLDAVDRVSGLPLLGATPRSARLTGQLMLPMRIRPSLTLLYWSATPSAATTSGPGTPVRYRDPFTRVDGALARSLAPGVTARVGVMNLFDRTPVDWPGNTSRRWYVGMSIDHGL